MSETQKFHPWAAIGKPNALAATIAEADEQELDAIVEQEEREARINAPHLPPNGSEERRICDLNHERMVRGLLSASRPRS